MSLIANNIHKNLGNPPQLILKDISLNIQAGDFVALKGRSGSGKSTLLYILSTLDNPSSGKILINDIEVSQLNSKDLHNFRNQNIGYVFQFHYLLPELSSLDNVLMPSRKDGKEEEKREYAHYLLELFGLSHRINHLPKQLSGGEQQRVAIARSLIMKPSFIFADEPTGNLDSVNSNNVFSILQKINTEFKTTIVVVTHDNELALKTKRIIELADGEVINTTC